MDVGGPVLGHHPLVHSGCRGDRGRRRNPRFKAALELALSAAMLVAVVAPPIVMSRARMLPAASCTAVFSKAKSQTPAVSSARLAAVGFTRMAVPPLSIVVSWEVMQVAVLSIRHTFAPVVVLAHVLAATA